MLGPVRALHACRQVLVAPTSQGVYALIVMDAWVVIGRRVEQRQLGGLQLVHRQTQLLLDLREVIVLLALTPLGGCCLGEALVGRHELILLRDGAAPVHVLSWLLLQPKAVITVQLHLREHRIRSLLLILWPLWGTPPR